MNYEIIKKILAYIVLFIGFSLICMGIVKADTTITTQTFPVIENYLQNNPNGNIFTFRDLVLSKIEKPTDFDNYEHYIVLMEIGNNNSYTIYFWLSDYFNFSKNANSMYLQDGPSDTRHSKRYVSTNQGFTFNNDYTDISFNGTWNESTTYFMWFNNPLKYIILASDLNEIQYARPTWQTDNFIIGGNTYALNSYIPFISLNYYNLNSIDYYAIPPTPAQPTLLTPNIEYFNGYNKITFSAEDYTQDTINHYNIFIKNLTTGNFEEYMQPTIDNSTNASITIENYENTTYYYYLLDINTEEILQDFTFTSNVAYENEQYFLVNVYDINNNNTTIKYYYFPNSNNTIENYKCYHEIQGQNKVEDMGCYGGTNRYELNVGGNKNVTFYVYDSTDNLIYKHNENFVFNQGELYITFNENYLYNYLNLDVIINRFSNGDIVKYSIDNGTLYTATLEEHPSYYNDTKVFTINNLSKGQVVNIYVYDSNNNLISSSQYNVNIYKNVDAWQTNYNIKDIFKTINIKNISNELVSYIKQLGELISNSKLGTLLLVQFSIVAICFILKLIRR